MMGSCDEDCQVEYEIHLRPPCYEGSRIYRSQQCQLVTATNGEWLSDATAQGLIPESTSNEKSRNLYLFFCNY